MGYLVESVSGRRTPLRAHHTLGRSADKVDTVISHPAVSRIHAVLEWQDGHWQIRDLSRNGCWVNGRRLPSNESVVLGGLIRERGNSASAGVPVLHKIPVLGALFGTEQMESSRTELLVIITPRALYNESELRDVSQEMRSRIRHMELLQLPPE